MAIGDVVSDLQSLSADATLDIRPGAGSEWMIMNIYTNVPAEIYFYDGTNSLFWKFHPFGIIPFVQHHVTNTRWLRIKALKAGLVGYTGRTFA